MDIFDSTNRQRLVDLIFEAGMLRKTPRTGYQFLGSGSENVAEHSWRVAIIGHILAKLAKADVAKTIMLCLYHDFHEGRTGDFNYVNYLYNSAKSRKAVEDATAGTGLASDILALWDEQDANTTLEARLAHDADKLDLVFNLYNERALGNRYADKWLISARARLVTEQAQELAELADKTDPTNWWYSDPDDPWWVDREGNNEQGPR